MRLTLPVLVALVVLPACKERAPQPVASPAAAPSTAGSASPQPSPSAPLPEARSVKEETDLYILEYAYPASAAAIPGLKARFDAEIDTVRAELKKDGAEGRKDAEANGFPFRPYGRWIEWKVVADLPGWLSLSASISTDTGGAHPNHGFEALVWDRQANRPLDPAAMFVGKDRLSAEIRRDFCRLLDREREKRRGEPVRRGDMFGECIDPLESTLILGSSNRKAFDRIGILVGPYAAGPYAEGDYEVTLPVTPAVLALVKPEYRSTFVVAR